MNPWSIAIHESAHAVVAHVLGLRDVDVTILPDAGGGFAEHTPEYVQTPWQARRAALVYFAGMAAERLFLPREQQMSFAPGETEAGPTSDKAKLISLAIGWGGEDPVAWDAAVRGRAAVIVSLYARPIKEGAQRLMNGQRLTTHTFPLVDLQPNPNLYREFPVPTIPAPDLVLKHYAAV